MADSTPKGFFAYPSNPPTLADAIRNGVQVINGGGATTIKTWEQCSIGGKVIIQELCKEIDAADFFLC